MQGYVWGCGWDGWEKHRCEGSGSPDLVSQHPGTPLGEIEAGVGIMDPGKRKGPKFRTEKAGGREAGSEEEEEAKTAESLS